MKKTSQIVAAVVGIGFGALLLDRDGSPSMSTSRQPENQRREQGAVHRARPTPRPTVEHFVRGFEDLVGDYCLRALGEARCRPQHLPPASEEASVVLETAFVPARSKIVAWLRDLGLFPRPDPVLVPPIRAYLGRQARGPMAPFSTLVAIETMRTVPDLAPEGLLATIIDRPALESSFVAWEALEALARSARPSDLEMLADLLRSSDSRMARRAMRALARAPGGAEQIVAFLGERPAIDDASGESLAAALSDAGLARNEQVIRPLIDASRPALVQAALDVLARSKEPPSLALLDRVTLLASSGGTGGESRRLRAAAHEILGAHAPDRLESIAGDANHPVDVRVDAITRLSDDAEAEAAELGLALFPESRSAAEAVQVAAVVARQPSRFLDLVRSAVEWLGRMPSERAAFIELLRTSRDPGLIALEVALQAGQPIRLTNSQEEP